MVTPSWSLKPCAIVIQVPCQLDQTPSPPIGKRFPSSFSFLRIPGKSDTSPVMRWPFSIEHGLKAPLHNCKKGVHCSQQLRLALDAKFLPHTPGVYVSFLKTLPCSNCHQRKPAKKEDAFAPYFAHPQYRAFITMHCNWNGAGLVIWYAAQRMILKAWMAFKIGPKRCQLGGIRQDTALPCPSFLKKYANISCGKSKLLTGTPSSSPFIGM